MMRRAICVVLALMLMFPAAITAFGTEKRVDTLEQAVSVVKSIVEIPEELTELDHYIYERDFENGAWTTWSLEWYDEDYNESIYAYVSGNGELLQYSRYVYADRSGFGKVTWDEGKEAAEAFLQAALPAGLTEGMRLVDEEAGKMNRYGFQYTYRYYQDEIPVPSLSVSIVVDKYEGYVDSYYGLNAGTELPEFEPGEPRVLLEDAEDIYLDQLGLQLQYQSSYDYRADELTVFPVYALNEMYGLGIDAVTGDLIELHPPGTNYSINGYGGYYGRSYYGSGYYYGESWTGLSDEEGTAGGYLSKERAAGALSGIVPYFKNKDLDGAWLYEVERSDKQYIWELEYAEGSAEVDAVTGEILSFYIYDDAILSGNRTMSEDETRQVAETFLKTVAPDKFANTEASSENGSYTVYSQNADADIEEYTFEYYRRANGIDYVDNSLYVGVSAKSGQIYRFGSSWYEGIVFPPVDDIISEKEAFDVLNSAAKLALTYEFTESGKASLVYQFSSNAPFYIDPLTGGKITDEGQPYTERIAAYDDIEGHWSQEIVETLLSHGYFIDDSQFRPDQTITQSEFLKYLYESWYDWYWYSGYYSRRGGEDELSWYLESMGITVEDGWDPDAALTRKDAAKFLIRHLGQDLSAGQQGIFINSFTDQVDEEYLGYAVLCKSMGILRGDRSGAFNADSPMSRAEAASAIYQLLLIEQ